MPASRPQPESQKENRPLPNNRHPTAPSIMTVNGHFANVGETPTKEQYERGIQVINEDQEFKYGQSPPRRMILTIAHILVLTYRTISNLRKSPLSASTIISYLSSALSPQESLRYSTTSLEPSLGSCPSLIEDRPQKEYGCQRTSKMFRIIG